jgi:hypothetical protein
LIDTPQAALRDAGSRQPNRQQNIGPNLADNAETLCSVDARRASCQLAVTAGFDDLSGASAEATGFGGT